MSNQGKYILNIQYFLMLKTFKILTSSLQFFFLNTKVYSALIQSKSNLIIHP